jgi:hypothetical protein
MKIEIEFNKWFSTDKDGTFFCFNFIPSIQILGKINNYTITISWLIWTLDIEMTKNIEL